MKSKIIATALICAALSSCQSGSNSKMQWVQFAPGEMFEIADARCRMMAQTQHQGIYAQGSASFVLGAQLGNALGNAIRMQQFYNQCMTMSGWKQVPILPKKVTPMAIPSQSGFPPQPT